MKKNLLSVALFSAILIFASCGGGADTPEGIAKQWCELNAKVHSAASEEEEDKARAEREKFEEDIEKKHEGDDAFMEKVEAEVEKCEDASEGR